MDTVRFTFANGKTVEFQKDWQKIAPTLQYAGVRLFTAKSGTLIPLNSNTIAMIELVEEDNSYEEQLEQAPQEPEPVVEVEEVKAEEPKDEKVVERPKSIQERKEEQLALMKELSDCKHEEHVIFYTEGMVGKSRTPVKRYFPVCKKCGVREKFIKAADLPDEVKEAAQLWDKS